MSDHDKPFSAVRKADETIALLIQHQPELIKHSYTSAGSAEEVAGFIRKLRQELTDMYNLTPPL